MAFEVNFDGIVGPTHNYGGLSIGNLASQAHGMSVSRPREAALQGLSKMKLLLDLGLKQGVIPPHERPDLGMLRRLGFEGTEARLLEEAQRRAPRLLAACWSASSMWAANAATVSSSTDAEDGRVHITPANLVSQLHRSLEAGQTARILRAIFPVEASFAHHSPLPSGVYFRDEGAANHVRLAPTHGSPGLQIFVYGVSAEDPPALSPRVHSARQTREASAAIARLHHLREERVLLLRQRPEAIDAGVFHNDVVALGNENVFLFHGQAYAEPAAEAIRRGLAACGGEPFLIEIPPERLSLAEAVETYFFNSQLVSLPGGGMCLVVPAECEGSSRARDLIQEIVQGENPILEVRFVDIRQSMKNGGGPACLRLRVVLAEAELARVHPGVLLTEDLYKKLVAWVGCRYRDHLHPDDLADPALIEENRRALDELTQLLGLGSIYPFQREGA